MHELRGICCNPVCETLHCQVAESQRMSAYPQGNECLVTTLAAMIQRLSVRSVYHSYQTSVVREGSVIRRLQREDTLINLTGQVSSFILRYRYQSS